jgi:putative transposase
MIEDGTHLRNCIGYVDLNMVRAGVVSHPCDWDWCGYHELVGGKTSYRLLDGNRLLELLAISDHAQFVAEYRAQIDEAIAIKKLKRQECWTESIAVGSQVYVRKIATAIRRERLKPRIDEGENGVWSVW